MTEAPSELADSSSQNVLIEAEIQDIVSTEMFQLLHQFHQRMTEAPSEPADSSSQNVLTEAEIQDIVWTKMQALKERYFDDLRELCNLLAQITEQSMPHEQYAKLSSYKTVLQRMIPYLAAPKGNLPKEFNQVKVEALEKQIVSILETFKPSQQWQQVP